MRNKTKRAQFMVFTDLYEFMVWSCNCWIWFAVWLGILWSTQLIVMAFSDTRVQLSKIISFQVRYLHRINDVCYGTARRWAWSCTDIKFPQKYQSGKRKFSFRWVVLLVISRNMNGLLIFWQFGKSMCEITLYCVRLSHIINEHICVFHRPGSAVVYFLAVGAMKVPCVVVCKVVQFHQLLHLQT